MKLLYLIGAGASSPTLPLVKELNNVNKIYIQNKEININSIKSKIVSLVPDFKNKIEFNPNIDQFFIPQDY